MNQQSSPTAPDAGSVITQATTIRPATPQRTSPPGLPTPDPRIEPVATCVVDKAIPQMAGGQDDHRRGSRGGHALRRADLHQTLAQGPDHPPAANPGSGGDGEGAGNL